MFNNHDIVGSILILAAFLAEFIIKMLHKPDKKLARDTMTNFSLGLFTLLVGFIEKGLALGLYSFVFSFSF